MSVISHFLPVLVDSKSLAGCQFPASSGSTDFQCYTAAFSRKCQALLGGHYVGIIAGAYDLA